MKLLTYGLQAGGFFLFAVGLYFALHEPRIFFTLLGGAGLVAGAGYYRRRLLGEP